MAEATTTTKKTTKARKPSASKATTSPKRKPASLDLPQNPLMFEILDLASRQRSKAKKVEVLKRYECLTLKSLFIWNFDETVISELPEGDVPYGNQEDQLKYSGTLSESLADKSRQMYTDGNFSLGSADSNGRTTLRAQTRNLYHFVRGGNAGLSGMRRESMFINLLESVHPLEAEIMVLVKDGLLENSYKVSLDIVKEAYPDISWGGRG